MTWRQIARRRDSLLALGGAAVLSSASGLVVPAPARASDTAYAFSLPEYGAQVALAERYRGKVIVLVNVASA
ncbi:MAG: hypothetical protein J3K34DRAFT_466731 [Monoraphidium minutum]|nr:MAG: hypothetical protein J3K34DRAFT_466731 [Monoraphidium minutum]